MAEKPRCPSCDADAGEDFIVIHNGLNAASDGFVHVAHGREMRVQMTPDEARTHGLRMIEAAEAAESDAAVYRLLTEKIGMDRSSAARIIADLRNYRDDAHKRNEGKT